MPRNNLKHTFCSSEWFEFLNQVEEAKQSLKFKDFEECFFRGENSSAYALSPGLLRGVNTKVIPQNLWNIESDLFFEFRAKARELHQTPNDDWDILFYMQHHGVKTRLLDWTDTLGVAIYFALFNYKPEKGNPCIWMLNPYGLNETFHSDDDDRDLFSPEYLEYYDSENPSSYSDILVKSYTKDHKAFLWNEPVALYPMRKAERLSTQQGYFTIHGNNALPLDQIVTDQKILRKVDLPKEAIPSAQHFLELAGINEFSLFPGLDGLSKYLNKKYFG